MYIVFSLLRFIFSVVGFDMVVKNANNQGKKGSLQISLDTTALHEVNAGLLIICHALSIIH